MKVDDILSQILIRTTELLCVVEATDTYNAGLHKCRHSPLEIKSSQCCKVASCFYSCLGWARNAAATADDNYPDETPMSVALPANCLTYRQIAGAGFGAGSAPARRVPVLFSTSRGLYLRVAQPTEGNGMQGGQHYDITFCDLERWTTNRANVISLEDTFGHLQPPKSQQQRAWHNNIGAHNMQR